MSKMFCCERTIGKKMIKRCKWFLGVASLLLILELAWADPKTEDVIKDIESKAATITSYRADIVIKSGQTMSLNGKEFYKKPDMIRIEMKTEMEINNTPFQMTTITVSDGNISYQYIPEEGEVKKVNLKEVGDFPSMSSQNVPDLINPFVSVVRETIQYIGEEELDGEKMHLLEGKPIHFPGMIIPFQPQKFKLWIRKKDGLLQKMVGFNSDGKEVMSQELKNIELNPTFADDTFRFVPPEGVQVFDITEDAKRIMERIKTKSSEK